MKVKINENLTALINYIWDSETIISWHEFVQFAIDYKMYKELYANVHILNKIIDEHDNLVRDGKWVKPS